MNFFYVLFLSMPLIAQSKMIELEITTKWYSKKAKEELVTLVFLRPGETLKLPLETRRKAFLNITAVPQGKEVILTTQLVEKKDGKDQITLDKKVRAIIGKKNRISERKENNEGIELEIIPGF